MHYKDMQNLDAKVGSGKWQIQEGMTTSFSLSRDRCGLAGQDEDS